MLKYQELKIFNYSNKNLFTGLLPEALFNQCLRCSQKDKASAAQISEFMKTRYPADWKNIINKFTAERKLQPSNQPQYNQPQYSQPQYSQPQYSQPQYSQVQYNQQQFRPL